MDIDDGKLDNDYLTIKQEISQIKTNSIKQLKNTQNRKYSKSLLLQTGKGKNISCEIFYVIFIYWFNIIIIICRFLQNSNNRKKLKK